MSNNKIKFKHFCGTLDRWNSKKSEWSDAIVFGRIHTGGKCLYKIYAGAIQGEDPNLYEYSFITAEGFAEYEEILKDVENKLHTDIDSSTGDVVFDDEDFRKALKNTINLLFTKGGKNLEKRFEAVEDAILWVTTEDID